MANNICGKGHERFRNECTRAKENNIKLVILCEELHNYNSLMQWQSPKFKNGKPMTLVKGSTLAKAMKTMQERYGVKFMFCRREDVGRRIVEILTEGLTDGK